MKTLIQSIIFLLLYISLGAQRPGDLNTNFASEGIFVADWEDTTSIATDIAVLPDGNLLITGAVNSGDVEQADILVMKLNDLGIPVTFGNSVHGFKYDINSSNNVCQALSVLPDNNILAAGMSISSASEMHPAAIRLLPDGQPDISFAEDGVFASDLYLMYVQNMEVYEQESSHAVLLCGETVEADPHPIIAMLNDAGEIESSFGIGGTLQLTGHEGRFVDLVVDAENDYLYGIVNLPAGGVLLTKFNLPDGSPNTEFGTGGILSFTPAEGFNGSINSIILDKTDNTLAAFGHYFHPDLDWDIFAYRINATDGAADESFGINGISTLRIPDKGEMINAAIIQSDGKYYFGGFSNYNDESDFFLGRINHDGIGDTSFGSNGLVLTALGSEEKVNSLALSPAEDVLYTAGISTEGTENKIIVSAYHTVAVTEPTVNGITDQDNEFRLYPNPSYGIVNIETGNTGQHEVQIYNLTGSKLFDKIFPGGSIELNLELLQPSIYYIYVMYPDGQTIMRKLIRL